MKDTLRIAGKVLGDIDTRILPAELAIRVVATCKLIDAELAPAPEPVKVVKKPAKAKAKKKVSKKKVSKKK